jgi:hypothetical protein
LIGRKNGASAWALLRNSNDESTGVSVSAMKSEIEIEHAIVRANCR